MALEDKDSISRATGRPAYCLLENIWAPEAHRNSLPFFNSEIIFLVALCEHSLFVGKVEESKAESGVILGSIFSAFSGEIDLFHCSALSSILSILNLLCSSC